MLARHNSSEVVVRRGDSSMTKRNNFNQRRCQEKKVRYHRYWIVTMNTGKELWSIRGCLHSEVKSKQSKVKSL